MKSLIVEANRNHQYPVYVGGGAVALIKNLYQVSNIPTSAIVVTDPAIWALHGDYLTRIFHDLSINLHTITFPQGEAAKLFCTINDGIDEMIRLGAKRKSILVAFGGGSITDSAGFIAAIYMRGIEYVNIPTTLVGQVDAAVGGKVAVNHSRAKNLIGAFHHPSAVFCEPKFLTTLEPKEISNGLAEAIKVAIISSKEYFYLLKAQIPDMFNYNEVAMSRMVFNAIDLKIRLLAYDPYEHDLKRLLNFGHCIAHALETLKHYDQISHGEAVAIGIATASRIALARKLLHHGAYEEIIQILTLARLPLGVTAIENKKLFFENLDAIRLIRNGALNLVIPTAIGYASIIDDVPNDEIVSSIVV